MENFRLGHNAIVSKFDLDLKLFAAPVPSVLCQKNPPDKLPQTWAGVKEKEETVGSELGGGEGVSSAMQKGDPPRYAPSTVYNPVYATTDLRGMPANGALANNSPPGSQAGVPAHLISLSGASQVPPQPGGVTLDHNIIIAPENRENNYTSSVKINRGPIYPGSPKHPSSIAQAQGSGASQMVLNTNSGSYTITPNAGLVQKSVPNARTGSNYSSPRSSIASLDSKGSSPRTSLVNPPPPPPYDFQRQGSPHSSVASPRSSMSAASLDSKHSSPRASLTGMSNLTLVYDKHPNARPDKLGAITIDGHLVNTDGPFIQRPHGISFFDRFNEPAPPPPYEARYKTGLTVHHVHSPRHINPAVRGGLPPGSHPEGQEGRQSAQVTMSISPAMATTMSAPRNNPVNPIKVQQKSTIPNIGTFTHGILRYDTVPSKQTQSDMEQKLAALTQQLENEMNITSSTSQPRKISMEIPNKPPPPYHGPHNTEPLAVSTYNSPNYTSPTLSQQSSPLSQSSSMSSLSVRSPLPMQVVPATPTGPSEAERKVEALTQELESQMEKHPQGDYFGEYLICQPLTFMFFIYLFLFFQKT